MAVGGFAGFHLILANKDQKPHRNVRLKVELAPELVAVPEGTIAPVEADVQAQRITFEPIAEIRPGESLRFKIGTNAVAAGATTIQAELAGDALEKPRRIQLPIEILDAE